MTAPVLLLLLPFLFSLCFMKDSHLLCRADPTDGFKLMPLTHSNFLVQKPYNLVLADRYTHIGGVHRLWVYPNDKPFKVGSRTNPRTEIRIQGFDYSSGVWQFEGNVFVPSGTSGASIMQIHRRDGQKPATDLMLGVYDGELRFYTRRIVEFNFYDRWIKINVIHDADSEKVIVFINGVQKYEAYAVASTNFYFKFGVYSQGGKDRMESRWRDVKVYKKGE